MAYRLTSSTAAASWSDARELPQLLQKRASGVLATEQTGQIVSSWLPHWEQNLEPGRFSCPHRGHCTVPCLLGIGEDNSGAGKWPRRSYVLTTPLATDYIVAMRSASVPSIAIATSGRSSRIAWSSSPPNTNACTPSGPARTSDALGRPRRSANSPT